MLLDIVAKAIKRKLYRPLKQFNISWATEKRLKISREKASIKKLGFINNTLLHYCDGPSLITGLKEVFAEAPYRFHTKSEKPYIIDCGGYIGLSALYFAFEHPNADIVVFEPDSVNFQLTELNVAPYKNRVTVENKAIWVHNETIMFNNSHNMGSSIVTGATATADNSVTEIPSARLKDWLTRKVDFLKIDIEGAEYEVLKDIKDCLHFVDNLFLEYHGSYAENNQLTEMLSLLTDPGYKWYIKEAAEAYVHPYTEVKPRNNFDLQLNIFAFKKQS